MLKVTAITNSSILAQLYGGKAAGLSLLFKSGYKIPKTVIVEATSDICEIDDDCFQAQLKESIKDFYYNGNYSFAVRSSCTIEDAFDNSMAGRYDTFLGEMTFTEVIQNIKEIIRGLSKSNNSNAKMGIVIQEKINADFSGVIFSSDPFTYSKSQMLLSFTSGIGDRLVSGSDVGTDIVISINQDNYNIETHDSFPIMELLISLAKQTKALERELNYPVDIEWAIRDEELFFLQCRPLASITKVQSSLRLVNEKNLLDLPPQLVSHDKVRLRLSAQQTNTFISDAYVYIRNICAGTNVPSLSIPKSQYCKGYSAVVIYPQRLSNKVIRSFVGDKSKVLESMTDCCRYGIRSFPKYENLDNCLLDYLNLVVDEYWISTTIIQEIFDPLYTGVIRCVTDGFFIEITRGHFITKGVMPVSQYFVNKNGIVLSRNEVSQDTWLKIIEGHIVLCICNEGESDLVSLTDENVKYIIDYFRASIKRNVSVVEFGILQQPSNVIQPYLIDFVDDTSTTNISVTDITEGIVSRGKISGKIHHIKDIDSDSLDIHFYDKVKEAKQSEENIIFFCQKPEIALLPLIEQYAPNKIGFVFQDGSILCHFAIVLREKGIPAIKVGNFPYSFFDGDICTIDADTLNLSGKERLLNG